MAITDKQTHEARELLPWYLNGTLSDEENEHVRQCIESSEELQAEVADTDALIKALGDDVRVPDLSAERIAGVMERLDEEADKSGTVVRLIDRLRAGPGRAFAQPERRSPFAFSGALPLALAAACALVAVVLYLPESDPGAGEYTTLYEDRPSIPIVVELTESVSAADAQALFAELAVTAAASQADGSYRVDLPEETTVDELYRILTALRADDRVSRAEALTDAED